MTTRIRTLSAALVLAWLCVLTPAARTVQSAGAVFRVFLTTGEALPSYGEAAIVSDRVVFTLVVSVASGAPTMQLVSLPAGVVDVGRTRRYATAVRAAHYAATRGDVDFTAMTREVERTLSQLQAIDEPGRRLTLAVEARRRLLAWADGTYGYRQAEVRELVGHFDELVADLGVAAGARQVSLDLRSDPMVEPEPLLAPPDSRDSIRLALAAARAADSEEERMAVLRAAETSAAGDEAASALLREVRDEITRDREVAAEYARLTDDVRARADAAMRQGDVPEVTAAIEALQASDRALGGRRPGVVSALAAELEGMLVRARAHRAALDRYARVRRSLLDYERLARPIMSGFDGLTPVFLALKAERYTALERLDRTTARLKTFQAGLTRIAPPEDLADVHATLASAIRMADHACARRRVAVGTRNTAFDREASSAAAGAMLLAETAREQLVARLYPPKFQ